MSMSFRFLEATGVVAASKCTSPTETRRRALRRSARHAAPAGQRDGLDIEGRTVLELSVCELDGAPVKPARRRSILAEIAQRIAGANGAPPPTKPLRAA
jgi:hypothetical protein